MESSLLQLLKAKASILVKVDGRETLIKLAHSAKVSHSKDFKDVSEIFAIIRLAHPEND